MKGDVKEVRSKFTTLFIDPVVMKRIMYYAQAADGEVSGLGTVVKDDKGRMVVNQVYLLEQESSGADTELNSEAISKLMTDMIGKNEDPGQLKFWWHSHASMGVFWSGTDDTCAETLSREFAFSLVVNKAGEKRCRLDLYNPFRVTFDGVKVEEISQEDNDLKKECELEVKLKVKTPYERYNNWKDDDYYGGGYAGGGFYGRRHMAVSEVKEDKKIDLPDHMVEDIERIIDIASNNAREGGVLCLETWNEYVAQTLKAVAEKRFEKKAGCNSFGTFSDSFGSCMDKSCKVAKACAYWTKVFEETEADAAKQLEDLNKEGSTLETIDVTNNFSEV